MFAVVMTRKWRFLLLALVLLALAWQLLRVFIPEQERALRTQVRESLVETFPEMANDAEHRFGLRRLSEAQPGRAEVVLVHGLDDPGLVWMNLVPALQAAGHGVSLVDYPNDQPIRASAAFLRDQLVGLAASVEQVQIVAHSMGGLVSRELLTSPDLACEPPVCRMPAIRRLIMVGTPNHGSDMARIRGLAEVREQLSRLIAGEAGWLDWVFDGAGEAGLDLLPGSEFLRTLNARPHPAHTELLVIAGIIGKQQIAAIEQLFTEQGEPPFNGLSEAGNHWGDGLVSLQSAQLPAVPLLQVPGGHLTMIRNFSTESERVPPAVPLILQLLEGGGRR